MAECQEIEVYKPPDLKARLKGEQDMLERYFWPVKYPILYKNDTPCFEHEVKKTEDRIYNLRVYVNDKYPHRLPDLVVFKSPEPMPNGDDWNGSHQTHTYPRMHGFLRICHWHWAAWKTENMIFQIFNKGEEWLEAYEKYLTNGKIKPLELEQMKLTEEEEIKEQIEIQRRYVQLQQRAVFALCESNPNFLNDLHRWHMHAVISEILSQRNLPVLPISHDEVRNSQKRLVESVIKRVQEDPIGITLAELFRLQCAITECRLANPGRDVNVSCTQTADGRFHVSVTPTGPRSLENS